MRTREKKARKRRSKGRGQEEQKRGKKNQKGRGKEWKRRRKGKGKEETKEEERTGKDQGPIFSLFNIWVINLSFLLLASPWIGTASGITRVIGLGREF